MSENFGTYLGEIRKAKSSILQMTPDEWQNVVDFASKTGQRIRIGGKDDITVDGVPMSYNAIVSGLEAIEAAEEYTANRVSL